MKPAAALLPFLLLAAPAHAPPAQAEEPSAAPEPGRYQFQSVEGGLARLDTATGEITLCRVDPARLACDIGGRPAAGVAAPALPTARAEDDAEFDRALGRMQRLFRAFGDVAREFDREEPVPAPNRT